MPPVPPSAGGHDLHRNASIVVLAELIEPSGARLRHLVRFHREESGRTQNAGVHRKHLFPPGDYLLSRESVFRPFGIEGSN